jgi:hypothetical protein
MRVNELQTLEIVEACGMDALVDSLAWRCGIGIVRGFSALDQDLLRDAQWGRRCSSTLCRPFPSEPNVRIDFEGGRQEKGEASMELRQHVERLRWMLALLKLVVVILFLICLPMREDEPSNL